jgi:hypothetical protein
VNQTLPDDFKEFLKLLDDNNVEYLLIGGYAVGYYGYPRTTADMDIWISINPENAGQLIKVFSQFGMRSDELNADLLLTRGNIIRMGVPPMRIEILNEIDGVEFDICYKNRESTIIDGTPVQLISLYHLKENKKMSGRHKDLEDLEHLP